MAAKKTKTTKKTDSKADAKAKKEKAEPKKTKPAKAKKTSAKAKTPAKKETKPKKETKVEPKKQTKAKPKKQAKAEPKKSSAKKTQPAPTPAPPKKVEPTLKSLSSQLTRMEKKITKQEDVIKILKEANREANKKISSMEKKLDTRVKREEVIMDALSLNSRSKKGSKGAIGEFNSSILKVEEYLLNTGNRIDNILSAVKNHREYLVKLNKRVYKEHSREMIEIRVDIIGNSLTLMMINGFDFDKSLLKDVEKLKNMIEKKDSELSKIRKKMNTLDKKYEEELERFDFRSIYEKKQDLPGYR